MLWSAKEESKTEQHLESCKLEQAPLSIGNSARAEKKQLRNLGLRYCHTRRAASLIIYVSGDQKLLETMRLQWFHRIEWATQAIYITTTSEETDCVGQRVHERELHLLWRTCLDASRPDICNPYGPLG
jgi:hypothetical protein